MIIKKLALTASLVAFANIYSSCDSCSRKTETTKVSTEETYDSTVEDTIETGDATEAINDNSANSTSINSTTSVQRNSSTATKSTATAKTTTTATSAKDEEARQQAITDRIENSDFKSAVDKNGNPIRSSGDAGSGMGTGTGSTGNNSRVTTREAQRAN